MVHNENFWLQSWIDEFEIYDRRSFALAVKSPTAVKSLFSRVVNKETRNFESHASRLPTHSALAGRHLDLSATFHHACTTCLSWELSTLLSQTMHFFDRVVVSGPQVQNLAVDLQAKDKTRRERALRGLRPHVEFFNHLRKIGALDCVTFAPKVEFYCQKCFNHWAASAGIAALENEDESQKIVDILIKEGNFVTLRDRTGKWRTVVSHPLLVGGKWTRVTPYSSKPTRKEIAWDIFNAMSKPVMHDLSTAQHYNLPLVEGFQAKWLAPTDATQEKKSATVEDVALQIRIPQLFGLPLEELIRLKSEHREHYIKFQSSISAAVRDVLSRHELEAPQVVAREVVREYVEPELAALEGRVRSKQRALGKKLAAAVTVGSSVTAVGMLASMPLVLATGVGAAATSLTQLYKYFDDKSDIETSDLYFLSKVPKNKH